MKLLNSKETYVLHTTDNGTAINKQGKETGEVIFTGTYRECMVYHAQTIRGKRAGELRAERKHNS